MVEQFELRWRACVRERGHVGGQAQVRENRADGLGLGDRGEDRARALAVRADQNLVAEHSSFIVHLSQWM